MIPNLDSIEQHGELCVWQTTDGVFGATCTVATSDIETCDIGHDFSNWEAALAALPSGLVVKIETSCALGRSLDSDTSRAEAISKTGFREYESKVHIQTSRNPFLEMIYRKRHGESGPRIRLDQGYKAFKDAGIALHPLGDIASCELFERNPSAWVLSQKHLIKGHSYSGVVRLFKPVGSELSVESMGSVLSKLPAPYKFTTVIQKSARERAQVNLRRRFRQTSGPGKIAAIQKSAVEDTLAETSFNGAELFEYEILVCIERSSEQELSEALLEAAGTLRVFGDVVIETVGVGPSYLATLPGIGLHVPLLEVSSTLPVFLPVWRNGSSVSKSQSGSLVLHRRDRSLDQIGLLDWTNQNANALIIGSSGKGKSALLGCLTQDLLQDQSTRIIKVDVGGSHSKECELLGGREYRLNLETENGLNPFELIGSERSESIRAVLGAFIEALVLEDGERRLPKVVRNEVDQLLQLFLEREARPSIDGLLKFEFSRRALLSRWGSGGLYGRAFIGRHDATSERLRYFNFQDIFQAKEEDFSRAVMASVLAVFNLEMRTNPGSRIILICDETPFFIEHCFDFFKTSSANVRKFGGGVILVSQTSQHLIREGDTALIENAQHRMFFSADGSLRDFQERFRLRDQDMRLLSSLRFSSRKFSEFIYQNEERGKAMRLELSSEEYWRVTSSQSDRSKLTNLIQAVPGLSTEEAIRCLSVKAGQF